MLPPVILMHMLDGSHSEVHFGGHVKLPSKEFPRDSPQTPWFYGSSSPYRAPIQGPQGPPLAEAARRSQAWCVSASDWASLGLGWGSASRLLAGFRLGFALISVWILLGFGLIWLLAFIYYDFSWISFDLT